MWANYGRLFNGINVNSMICVVYKSHYEALNIQKTATHKEIKDAYYRLSMIYHPDKNKGSEEAARNFRDITSAYEILGNVRQRRLYDSGANLITKNSQRTTQHPFEPMTTNNEVYNSKFRSRDYNFDMWSKKHYTNAFNKHYTAREKLLNKENNEKVVEQQHIYSVLTIMVGATITILAFMFENVKNFKVFKQDIINSVIENNEPKTKND